MESGRGGLSTVPESDVSLMRDAAGGSPDGARRTWVFEGQVACLAQPRAHQWRLRGRLAALHSGETATAAELLLSGAYPTASAQQLPARLHDLRVQAMARARAAAAESTLGPSALSLQLESRETTLSLQVDSIQLHRDASQAFFKAVPRAALSLRTRMGWMLLLTLLRAPLVPRLLKRPSP